jgi:hypothetical protein
MNCFSVNFVGILLMIGHFPGQLGLWLMLIPIMPADYSPVNSFRMLKRQTRKSLNEFFTILWGVESIVSGAFRQLVRSDAFYHSLFQLGLIYLDHLLNEYLSFPELLTLPRPDSFEHVVIT